MNAGKRDLTMGRFKAGAGEKSEQSFLGDNTDFFH